MRDKTQMTERQRRKYHARQRISRERKIEELHRAIKKIEQKISIHLYSLLRERATI